MEHATGPCWGPASATAENIAMRTDRGLGNIEIFRDRFGVPHVFADDLAGAYFGLGYCAAQDRPRTLPLHQLLVEGRLAERLGNRTLPDPELPFLDGLVATPFFRGYAEKSFRLTDLVGVDRWMRTFDYIGTAREGLSELGPRSQTILEAFCDGVNHYYRSAGAPSPIEQYRLETELAWWSQFEHTISMGFFISNAFVIAPSRTESGAVWIAGDPHYWFLDGHAEAHIACPELDLSGVWDGHVNLGMWGGTNRFIAMHLTAAGLEGSVVYRERVNPENRETYWDWRTSEYRRFASRQHEIRVAGGGGETFVARRSHHGPVIGEALVEGLPVAYTIRSPFLQRAGRRLEQHLELWTKRTAREFLDYLSKAEYVRGHRLAGDREGNIGYVCNGPVPVRSDALNWSAPVDGGIPEAEWSDQLWRPGASEYALPSLLNPECGFIQSANDPPWTTTVPSLVGRDFPRYLFPEGWRDLGTRGARQRQVLSQRGRLSREQVQALLLDVFVPRAHLGIAALRRRFEAERDRLPPLSAAAERLDALLAGWDGRAEVGSVAMAIAFLLNRALENGLPAPVVQQCDDPQNDPELQEPTEFPTSAGAYARGLEEVAEKLLAEHGTLEKPWGEMHVLPRPRGDIGIPGGANALRALLGAWRGWWDVPEEVDSDGVQRVNFGSRTLRFSELGPQGTSVRSVTITGQIPAGEHPGSPHVTDQSELYARLELKHFPIERDEVEADARATDHVACNHGAFVRVERPRRA